jgi:hypothetical protein
MWVIGIFNLAIFIGGLASGNFMAMIASIVLVPIFGVAELIALRIACEIFVVILLFPYYFKNSNKQTHNVTVIEDPSDDGDMDVSLHRQLV